MPIGVLVFVMFTLLNGFLLNMFLTITM